MGLTCGNCFYYIKFFADYPVRVYLIGMQELYFPEAIVLDREDVNGFDSRYSVYAKGFGKFFAKATSARKITSKLAPHLEPGNLVKIRVVGNGNFQVVDVLKNSKISIPYPDLYLLNQILPEHDFEFSIWSLLTKGDPSGQVIQNLDWRLVLKALGWDPEHGSCEICQTEKPDFFDIGTQGFFCEKCFGKRREVPNFYFKSRSRDVIRFKEVRVYN